MKENANRFKMVLIIAIAVIALLLIISVSQIVVINKKNKQKRLQDAEIERLIKEKEYYQNQLDKENKDDKDFDSEIVLGENE